MTKGTEAWSAQTKNQNEMTYRLFCALLGDKPVGAVTRGDVVRFKGEVLDLLPKTHGKSPKHRDRTLEEILKDAAESGAPTISSRTVQRHTNALSGFFAWAKGLGLHSGDNPARGFRFPKSKRARDQRPAWNNEELSRLFASPIWTGCHPVRRVQRGTEIIRDLRVPEQAEQLRELVRQGDVFSQSYRPGTLAARGFSPEALAALVSAIARGAIRQSQIS